MSLIDSNPTCVNKNLSDIIATIATYYALTSEGKNKYRYNAFVNASNTIANWQHPIISGKQAVKDIKGVGKSTGEIIDEVLKTGYSTRLMELETIFSERKKFVDHFTSFFGIGPVKANELYSSKLRTVEDIYYKGNLTQAQKLGIEWNDHTKIRINRDEMDEIAKEIGKRLNNMNITFDIAGSYRRLEVTSGDIDVLIKSNNNLKMDDIILVLDGLLPATLAVGPTKFMGIIKLSENHNGHRIDIRLVHHISYPYALFYFTGSKNFNILVRQRAIDLGYYLNEYGLYDNKNTFIICLSENDIFNKLGLQYVEPHNRLRDIISLFLSN